MADSPDDTTQRPTPPRPSKSAPPFFGPRTSKEVSEITEPQAPRRRSSGLFVPPGSLPPEEKEVAVTAEAPVPAAKPESTAPPPGIVDVPISEGAAAEAKPAAEPPPLRLSGYFELENLETPEITLKPESDRPALGGSELQVIEYEDANSGLASSTPPGGRPSFDGIEFESTELTIELSQDREREKGHAPSDLNVESFWAADAFTPTARPTREVPRASQSMKIDPVPIVPAIEFLAQPPAPPAAPPIEPSPALAAPSPVASPVASPPAPTISPPPAPPTPPAAATVDPPELELRRSAMDALRVEEVLPPRSPTPPSVRAVTPRNPVPAFSDPPSVRTPAALEALKELEPWAVSAMERPEIAAAIAFELERVARRIRNGELRVRTDVAAPNEESALSAALQAITRTQRH